MKFFNLGLQDLTKIILQIFSNSKCKLSKFSFIEINFENHTRADVNRVSLALHDKIHKIIPTQFFWVHLAFWVSKLENQKEKKSKHFFFLSFSTLRKSKAKSKREFLSLSFFPSLQARQVKARVTSLFLSLFLLFSWERNIIETLQEKLSPSQKTWKDARDHFLYFSFHPFSEQE